MTKIIFLGTASSIPSKTRDNTSFVISHKATDILVDCPGSISQKLLKCGIDFKKLKNVIITHEHPDHIYGIVSLIHTQAFLNDTLNIFSNSASIKIVKQLVRLFGLTKKYYPKLKYINVFGKKIFLSKCGLKLQAIKNKHSRDSFGIKIYVGKKALFYSSDTSFSLRMLKEAGSLDYLIHDCTASDVYFRKHPSLYKMHTSAKTLSDYLKEIPKTKLIPVHFLLLEKNEENRIKKELQEIKKKLILVKDYEQLRLL